MDSKWSQTKIHCKKRKIYQDNFFFFLAKKNETKHKLLSIIKYTVYNEDGIKNQKFGVCRKHIQNLKRKKHNALIWRRIIRTIVDNIYSEWKRLLWSTIGWCVQGNVFNKEWVKDDKNFSWNYLKMAYCKNFQWDNKIVSYFK